MLKTIRIVYLCQLVLVLSLLAACTVGPDYQKSVAEQPQQWADLPAAQQTQMPSKISDQALERSWWMQFNDPKLTDLIERALRQNLNLRAAAAVLAQSRAQHGIAAADQFPLLNGNAAYTRIQSSKQGVLNLTKTLAGNGASASSANGSGMSSTANGTGIGAIGLPAAGIQPFSLYQFGFDAAWELDLWGRVRREMEAADASVAAAQEQQYAAQLSVIAEVARNYIELRRLQNNQELIRQALDLYTEQVHLLRLKAERGIVTEMEVDSANTALANQQAILPPLQQQIVQVINSLSLLLGNQPGQLNNELNQTASIPKLPPQVNLGLPSELALRRPDIREAEAQLHQALAEIGMATADFYPRFTLSGSTGLQALRLQNLGDWSALQYAMGPSITLPIFQGGRLISTLEFRQAAHQQAAIRYQNTLLSAWHEIDNDISAFNQAQQRQQALVAAVQSNTQIEKLGLQRYEQGVSDYLPVLQARSERLKAEQAQVDGSSNMATNLVALYKAMGGGWQEVEQ